MTQSRHLRRHSARLLLAGLLASFVVPVAGAQNPKQATFILRPHCDSVAFRAALSADAGTSTQAVDDATCPKFPVRDPQTLETAALMSGDPLDMDLVIENPSALAITRFRAWVAYDPSTLG